MHTLDDPEWLLDELAHAGRENLDADHVSRYDRKEDATARPRSRCAASWGSTTHPWWSTSVRAPGSSRWRQRRTAPG